MTGAESDDWSQVSGSGDVGNALLDFEPLADIPQGAADT